MQGSIACSKAVIFQRQCHFLILQQTFERINKQKHQIRQQQQLLTSILTSEYLNILSRYGLPFTLEINNNSLQISKIHISIVDSSGKT